jgi:Fe-S cluster assembly protein SufD
VTFDEVLATVELPGRKDEAWKYTRADALLDAPFAVPAAARPVPTDLVDVGDAAARLVWIDGVLDRTQSRWPDTVAVEPLPPVASTQGFDALNLAFARDALRLVFRAGVPPLTLVHVSTGGGALAAVRREVVVPAGVVAEIHEHYLRVGEGPTLVTGITDVTVEGSLTVLRTLDEPDGRHFGAVRADVRAGGRCAVTVAAFAAKVARVEVAITLAEGADAALSGLSLLRGGAHVDHHVTVDHVGPNAKSVQRFRALLHGASRSVFTGRVVVRPGADGTDADQIHRALLLSDDGIVNARPQLEIHADDVKCAHGAAVGALDEEMLFYLRQRGLDPHAARTLLTEAFAAEIVAEVPASARERVASRIRCWLEST